MAHLEVIGLDEILLAIFQQADSPTLAQCMLVSRSWNELASRVLWRDLPSMFPLLQLLGLRLVEHLILDFLEITNIDILDRNFHEQMHWDFKEQPSADQWDRWSQYAPKVRRIFNTDRVLITYQNPNVPTQIGTLRHLVRENSFSFLVPRQRVLPFLESLQWESDISTPELLSYVIPFLCPSLKVLALPNSEEGAVDHCMGSAIDLLNALRALDVLHLRYLDLGCLTFTTSIPRTCSLIKDLLLDLTGLQHLGLRVDTPSIFPQQLQGGAETLAQTLKVLELYLPQSHAAQFTFEPLDYFKSLVGLVIKVTDDAYTRAVMPRDVFFLGKTWSHMTRLELRGTPGGLHTLTMLAEHLPLLQVLGFRLTLTSEDLLEAEKVNPVNRLDLLETFYTGYKHQTPNGVDTSRIAAVIAKVCPPGFEFCFRMVKAKRGTLVESQTKDFILLKEAVERIHRNDGECAKVTRRQND